MNKNNSPFDHYSEKVFWLFVVSVGVSILSVVLSFFIARGYMESVKQIKIECGASGESAEIIQKEPEPIIFGKG